MEKVTNENQGSTRTHVDGTRFESLHTEFIEQGQIDRAQGGRFLRSTIHRALALRQAAFVQQFGNEGT